MPRFNLNGHDAKINKKIGEFLLTIRDGREYADFRHKVETNGPDWFQDKILSIIKGVDPSFGVGGRDKFVPVFDGEPSAGGDNLFYFVIPDPQRVPGVGSLSDGQREEYEKLVGRTFLGPCG